jgi:ATP-dependent Lhr-like helicase
MELSGEVMAGIFFHGIPGPQFISPRAFRALQQKLPEESVYWMNATDPVSLCGLQLESLRGTMPARLATNHLVFRGTRVVLVSKRNGRDLTFHVPVDDPHFSEYLCVLRHLLTRRFQPLKRIAVETINGERAVESPYLTSLRSSFEASVDPHELSLYRTMN